jgi:hypothetical protein
VKFGLSLEGITMIWGISRTESRGGYAGLRGREGMYVVYRTRHCSSLMNLFLFSIKPGNHDFLL